MRNLFPLVFLFLFTASFSQNVTCTGTTPILNKTSQLCEKCTVDTQCLSLNITCAKDEQLKCLETGDCKCAKKPGIFETIVNAFGNLGIPSIVIYVLIGLLALWILSTVAAKLIKFGIIILILFVVVRIILGIIK